MISATGSDAEHGCRCSTVGHRKGSTGSGRRAVEGKWSGWCRRLLIGTSRKVERRRRCCRWRCGTAKYSAGRLRRGTSSKRERFHRSLVGVVVRCAITAGRKRECTVGTAERWWRCRRRRCIILLLLLIRPEAKGGIRLTQRSRRRRGLIRSSRKRKAIRLHGSDCGLRCRRTGRSSTKRKWLVGGSRLGRGGAEGEW